MKRRTLLKTLLALPLLKKATEAAPEKPTFTGSPECRDPDCFVCEGTGWWIPPSTSGILVSPYAAVHEKCCGGWESAGSGYEMTVMQESYERQIARKRAGDLP